MNPRIECEGLRPLPEGECVSPDHDQSWPGNGLRSSGIHRDVGVRGQPQPLRCHVKRAYGDKASAWHTQTRSNLDEATVTLVIGGSS
jgi:hypothetical protein